MWESWLALKTYHRRPSLDLEVSDSIAAWCVDGCVLWFGVTIENALAERKETGTGKHKEWRNVYTLEQLLDDKFKLPRPPTKLQKRRQGASNLLSLASDPRSGVKMWRELKPGEQPQGKAH